MLFFLSQNAKFVCVGISGSMYNYYYSRCCSCAVVVPREPSGSARRSEYCLNSPNSYPRSYRRLNVNVMSNSSPKWCRRSNKYQRFDVNCRIIILTKICFRQHTRQRKRLVWCMELASVFSISENYASQNFRIAMRAMGGGIWRTTIDRICLLAVNPIICFQFNCSIQYFCSEC